MGEEYKFYLEVLVVFDLLCSTFTIRILKVVFLN